MATNEIRQIITIAADISKIRGDLNTLEGDFRKSVNRIQSIGSSALNAFGIGLGASALVSFGKQVIDAAGQLQDLAAQTGISAATLSGLKSTLEQNGTSVDAFAKGIFNAQRALGQVDEEGDLAARAVRALGLNLNELRSAGPERFLELVAGALSRVENPMDRAALGAQLLGKAFKELAPALAEIAPKFDQLKNSGMNQDTINRLDQFGDSITKISNALQVLAATPLSTVAKIFSLFTGTATAQDAAVEKLSHVTAQIAAIDRDLAKLAGAADPVLVRRAEVMKAQLAVLGAQQAALEKAAGKGVSAGPASAPFKNLLGGAKSTDEAQKIADAIHEQNIKLQAQVIELQDGKAAAEAYTLAQTELKEGAKGLTGAIIHEQDRRRDLTAQIREQTDAFARLQMLVDATRGEPILEDVRFGLTPEERSEALAALDAIATRSDDAKKKLEDLRQSLQLGAMDTSTAEGREKQRIAAITLEFVKTANEIERLGHEAGISQAEIAENVALAWKKALQDIKNETTDVTEFQRRAWERMADTISDTLQDLLSGQIKSWDDLARRLNNTLTSIIAEAGSIELKKIILGPEYGKKGGELGGLAKDAMDFINGLLGRTPEQRGVSSSGAVQAFADAANEGVGNAEPLATTEAAIQAVSLQGTTAIDASLVSAQTNIQAIGATAEAALQAELQAALAAIEAAKMASQGGQSPGGMPSIPFMGGQGGDWTPATQGGGFDAWDAGGFGGSTAASGASSAASSSWIDGLMSMFSFAHEGGPVKGDMSALFADLKLKPNERPIIAEDGEFIFRKEAVQFYGLDWMNRANRKLELPRFHDGGLMSSMRDLPMAAGPGRSDTTMEESAGRTRGGKVEVHIHGARDPNQFGETRNQWMGHIARAVRRGQKEL